MGPALSADDGELRGAVATFGGALDLPTRGQDIPEYLASFAIGGRRWPDNGLSVDENRDLFESEDPALPPRWSGCSPGWG